MPYLTNWVAGAVAVRSTLDTLKSAIGLLRDAKGLLPEGDQREKAITIALEFYRGALRLTGGRDGELQMVPANKVDVVFALDSDEVMMKVRAIDCHRSQLEDWRIAIREHPKLLQEGYGHEPYVAISSRATGLTPSGLLGEFT